MPVPTMPLMYPPLVELVETQAGRESLVHCHHSSIRGFDRLPRMTALTFPNLRIRREPNTANSNPK
jgi:hypothetical protein